VLQLYQRENRTCIVIQLFHSDATRSHVYFRVTLKE